MLGQAEHFILTRLHCAISYFSSQQAKKYGLGAPLLPIQARVVIEVGDDGVDVDARLVDG